MPPYEFEKREFIRIRCAATVRFKYLSRGPLGPEADMVYEGTTTNLGAGGLLMTGKIPNLSWLTELLSQKILIGVNLYVTNSESPVKALTRVAWLEPMDEKTHQCTMGLMFRDIAMCDKDKIIQYIIRSHIST